MCFTNPVLMFVIRVGLSIVRYEKKDSLLIKALEMVFGGLGSIPAAL